MTVSALEQVSRVLHGEAAARAGRFDFGDPDYREGLDVLLDAIRRDLDLDPADARLRDWLVRPLVSRLYAIDGARRETTATVRRLVRPLVITGVPRSGTTALHEMLAANPVFQSLEGWLIRTPMRRPPRAQWDNLSEYRRARRDYEARLHADPSIRAIHLMAPWEPDECAHLLAQSFICNAFGSRLSIPSYDRWWRAQPQLSAYLRLDESLRVIGAGDDRRWLLKNPSHILHLDVLFTVFPDAFVVHLHRDPVATMPSLCSLLAAGRETLEGRSTDLNRLAQRELALWSGGVEAARAIEEQHESQILTIHHSDFVSEPMTVAREIHAFAGQPWDATAESAIARWIAANPRGRHGTHRYDAETFGMTRDTIAEAFAPYRARHGFRRAA